MGKYSKQIKSNLQRHKKQTELARILQAKGRTGNTYCSCGGCLFVLGDYAKCGDCGRIYEKGEKQ